MMLAVTLSGTTTMQLAAWFAEKGIPLTGDPVLSLIAGGHSNLTYRVTDDGGQEYVLRRPPLGHVLQSAHDVGREHRIISALEPTSVPVAHSYGYCDDVDIIGAPFYVMNFVPGTVVASHEDGAEYPPAARPAACAALVKVLASIHTADVDEIGLGELGRKADYAARQLKRWQRQFHASATRELPLVDEVHDRLAAAVPPQRCTGLVHGDYRPGNLLLSPEGRVNAVLDWELATLGDTLADLGYLTATWREPGGPELLQSPTDQDGYWTRTELIDEYEKLTGRDVSDIGWYQAFGLWRLTCIGEGVYARYRAGVMGNDNVDIEAQGERVIHLAEAAHDLL
jgi:aminoglycoside phosphotransferase (APT) family kinase protein